jgi:hypothetical protein
LNVLFLLSQSDHYLSLCFALKTLVTSHKTLFCMKILLGILNIPIYEKIKINQHTALDIRTKSERSWVKARRQISLWLHLHEGCVLLVFLCLLLKLNKYYQMWSMHEKSSIVLPKFYLFHLVLFYYLSSICLSIYHLFHPMPLLFCICILYISLCKFSSLLCLWPQSVRLIIFLIFVFTI